MSQLKLTDVAKINMGQSPSSETYNSEKNGLPFYQGNVDFGEKYPTVRIWCDKPTKIAEPGDILMSVRAPIGALNYANEKCCIGRGLAAITPDPDMTSSEFIYWFLRARHSELNRIGTGSTFKAINRKTLESIEFPKYNKNEQYYIAEILSKIDKTIGEKKAQLEKLDNLIKARFVEMFGCGYEEVELSELGKISTGSTPSMKNKDFYENTDTPFYKPGDFIDGVSNIDCSESFIDARAESISKIMNPGTVAVTCIGIIGKIGIIKRRGICNQQINFITPNDNVNSTYLAYAIDTKKRFMQEKANVPVVPILNKTNFSKVTIPFAPVKLQNQFATFVAQVDKSKFAVQKSLEKTQLLFNSLMQEYFG